MSRILVVEDDALFAETLEDFLQSKGHQVAVAHNADEANEATFKGSFDLMILDINLPNVSGTKFLSDHRSTQNSTPAIFITSYSQKSKLTEAFIAGGDDFMTKPIDLDELNLRIGALLRRSTLISSLVELGSGISFDIQRQVLLNGTTEQKLPKMAIKLLSLLVKNIGKTVAIEMIENELYSLESASSYGSIRVYVNQIKKAIAPNKITNIKGIGYRLEKP